MSFGALRGDRRGVVATEYVCAAVVCALCMVWVYGEYNFTLTDEVRARVAELSTGEEPSAIDGRGNPSQQGPWNAGRPGSTRPGGKDQCSVRGGRGCPTDDECFAPGTLVSTASGLQPIEALRVGDLVWSRDAHRDDLALKPVMQTFVKEAAEVITLELQHGSKQERLVVTPEHPFWSEGRGWTEAGALAATTIAGALATTLEASALATTLEASAHPSSGMRSRVHNIEVADYHTYFVGELNAWVHNRCRTQAEIDECAEAYLDYYPDTTLTRNEIEKHCSTKRFNPSSGRFKGDNSKDIDIKRCYKGPGTTIPPGGKTFSKERDDLLAARAVAECAGQESKVKQLSAALGEHAAREYGSRAFPKSEGWEVTEMQHSGVFDLVYRNRRTGELVVVEAKGGSSGNGARDDGAVNKRVQQGTLQYAYSIANNLRNRADSQSRRLGADVRNALGNNGEKGNFRYYEVRQNIGRVDCSSSPPKYTGGSIDLKEYAVFGGDRQSNPACR